MSKLDLTFSDVYTLVSEYLGIGSSPTGTDLTLCKDIVYRAYRKVLNPLHPVTGRKHQWSWLRKWEVIRIPNGRWRFALPNDFGEMVGNPHYSLNYGYRELTKVSPDRILEWRATTEVNSFPTEYAIVPLSTDEEMGTKYEVWLWPTPNSAYTTSFSYYINIEKPEDDADYFLGGPYLSEVILQCALAIAEHQEDEMKTSHHNQLAESMLNNAILSDTVATSDTVGLMLARPVGPRYYRGYRQVDDSTIYYADQ